MGSRDETRQKVYERKLKESYEKLKTMTEKAGFVYVIVHNSWPKYSKIGCTRDPIQRLNVYSTYDPTGEYKMVGYRLVEDMYKEEKLMHSLLSEYRLNSEWFDVHWYAAVGFLKGVENRDYIMKKYKETRKRIYESGAVKALPVSKIRILSKEIGKTL